MSSASVRQAFRTDLQAFLAGKAPFVDTLNNSSQITYPLWVTCVFYAFSREAHTCEPGVERGVCEVYVFGQGGLSDAPVLQLADEIENHFSPGPLLLNNVSITKTTPPNEATAGDGTRFYGLMVAVDYWHKP